MKQFLVLCAVALFVATCCSAQREQKLSKFSKGLKSLYHRRSGSKQHGGYGMGEGSHLGGGSAAAASSSSTSSLGGAAAASAASAVSGAARLAGHQYGGHQQHLQPAYVQNVKSHRFGRRHREPKYSHVQHVQYPYDSSHGASHHNYNGGGAAAAAASSSSVSSGSGAAAAAASSSSSSGGVSTATAVGSASSGHGNGHEHMHGSHGLHGVHGSHGGYELHEGHGSHGSLGGHGGYGLYEGHGGHGSHGLHGVHGGHGGFELHEGHGSHGLHGVHGSHTELGGHGGYEVLGGHGSHGLHGLHGGHGLHGAHGSHGSLGGHGGYEVYEGHEGGHLHSAPVFSGARRFAHVPSAHGHEIELEHESDHFVEAPVVREYAHSSGTMDHNGNGWEKKSVVRNTEDIQKHEEGSEDSDHYLKASSYGKAWDESENDNYKFKDEDIVHTPNFYRKKKTSVKHFSNKNKVGSESGSDIHEKDSHSSMYNKDFRKLRENVDKREESQIGGKVFVSNTPSELEYDIDNEMRYDSRNLGDFHGVDGSHYAQRHTGSGASAAAAAAAASASSSTSASH